MSGSESSYRGRPSWWSLVGSFAALAILVLMPFFETGLPPVLVVGNVLLSLFILFSIIFYRFGRFYTIADGLITIRRGVFRVEEKSMRVRDLREVRLKRTLFRRLLDIGDVEFVSSGGNIVTFEGIDAPGLLVERMHPRRKSKKKRRRAG